MSSDNKKLVMVDCLQTFLVRYCVELDENDPKEYALDDVVMTVHDPDQIKEFSQKDLGLNIISHREIDKQEYIRVFDEDNDYLKDWPQENKFKFINRFEE